MATNFDSAEVAGGDDALATQYNALRKDAIQNSGDYAASGGAANAYTLAIDAAIAAYNEGQVFKFKANHLNTGASTLNVNGIGALTIKKEGGAADLEYGDIVSGQGVLVLYDGTNLLMLSPTGQKDSRGTAATAGEDVDGSGTPQAVYISDGTNGRTAGRYYKGDANDVTNGAKRFDGFVKNNITTGNVDFVITEGVVGGFAGLTQGEYYYLNTAAGDITLTDTGILVGVAKSATEIIIQKELKLYACGTDNWNVTANGQTKTITHNLGRKPKVFKVKGNVAGSFGWSEGVYDVINANHAGIYYTVDSNQVQKVTGNTHAKIISAVRTADQAIGWDATVTSTTDTTCVMTSANYVTTVQFNFYWEAWA